MSSNRKPAFGWIGIEGVYVAINEIKEVVKQKKSDVRIAFFSEDQVLNSKKSNSKSFILDSRPQSIINSTSELQMSLDQTILESKASTAVTSTEISPLMQALPKINISSLLEKRPQLTSEIQPIRVEPVRPFTSVDTLRPFGGKLTSSTLSDLRKRDTKALQKNNVLTAPISRNVTSNFNFAHKTSLFGPSNPFAA
jgi:adenine-specific DNA methylase